MIQTLLPSDFDAVLRVINDAAQAYKGVIPDDRWKEPYMSAEELKEEIEVGVRFFCFKLVSPKKKDKLLRAYWNIPDRQVETSIVLKFTK